MLCLCLHSSLTTGDTEGSQGFTGGEPRAHFGLGFCNRDERISGDEVAQELVG
jgi:hypothetical protein